jgi:hypothetical protein
MNRGPTSGSRKLARNCSPDAMSSAFEDPIALPKGRQLLTLQDAADYIMKLPMAEQDLPEWQTAIEQLIRSWQAALE